MLSFTIGATSITVFIDGNINTIDISHMNYDPLLEELRKAPADRDLAAIKSFVTVLAMIDRYVTGKVSMTDALVLFEGNPVGDLLAKRMLEIFQKGIDVTPYALFMENVRQNPADYVHMELYEWMEKGNLPITPDGHLIAFKKVRDDYKDCHTGKFDNSVGAELEMDRDACDTNRHEHCSTGFHFCSPDYLNSFRGDRVMILKINPRDVTSIPSDYNFTKGRTCRYIVIGELTGEAAARHKVWSTPVVGFDDAAEFPAHVVKALLGVVQAAPKQLVQLEDSEPDIDLNAADDEIEGDLFCDVCGEVGCDLAHDDGDIEFEDEGDDLPESAAEPVVAGPVIERVGDKLVVHNPAAEMQEQGDELVFKTTDGREFAATVVKAAMLDASIRGAARNLGIGDSTLRGWLKRIDNASVSI